MAALLSTAPFPFRIFAGAPLAVLLSMVPQSTFSLSHRSHFWLKISVAESHAAPQLAQEDCQTASSHLSDFDYMHKRGHPSDAPRPCLSAPSAFPRSRPPSTPPGSRSPLQGTPTRSAKSSPRARRRAGRWGGEVRTQRRSPRGALVFFVHS